MYNLNLIKSYDLDTLIYFDEEKAKLAAQEICEVCNVYNNRENKEIKMTIDNINDIGENNYNFMSVKWNEFRDIELAKFGLPYTHTVYQNVDGYHSITDTDRMVFAFARRDGYSDFEQMVKEIHHQGNRSIYAPNILSDDFLKIEEDTLLPKLNERELSELFSFRTKDRKEKDLLKILRKIKKELQSCNIKTIPYNLFNYCDSEPLFFKPAQFNELNKE